MPQAVLTTRERVVWLAAFVLIAGLLVATKFVSVDADSVRYAIISARLTALPVARWVAPEWWGITTEDGPSGYFQEHPAGLFLIPAVLGRLGVPADQAPYIFGVAAGLAALILTGSLVARLTSRENGRAALVLLQLMPMAFVFRIRDNHEYPMLICLLITLIGLDRVSRSWRWLALVVLGFVGGLLVKGVFVVLVLIGAAWWVLFNPTGGSRIRQVVACGVALVCMALAGLAYDAWYLRETGGTFWSAYWRRQLGPMRVTSPLTQMRVLGTHIGFYILRLLFHPAPWSLALVWAAWRKPGVLPGAIRERRALQFALAFTATSVLLLSVASRFAERYAFSATYVVAAVGAVAAYRIWPALRDWLNRADAAVPAFAAVMWFALLTLRLALGPWLPRIGG
jgi:4-amino-4-deoxy-L-arabinose transferase-like glycosyltransferase